MSDSLILIHLVFIVALVWFVFRSGEKSGRSQMVLDFLDRGLVNKKDLIQHYDLKPKD